MFVEQRICNTNKKNQKQIKLKAKDNKCCRHKENLKRDTRRKKLQITTNQLHKLHNTIRHTEKQYHYKKSKYKCN